MKFKLTIALYILTILVRMGDVYYHREPQLLQAAASTRSEEPKARDAVMSYDDR